MSSETLESARFDGFLLAEVFRSAWLKRAASVGQCLKVVRQVIYTQIK